MSGFSSVLTFVRRNLPPNSTASFSRIGFSARHGPHQGAQKSMTTGVRFDAFRMSWSKSVVVESKEWVVILCNFMCMGLLGLWFNRFL
jgi:hypothetical protein